MYLSYFGVRVRDLPRSVRFYRDLFGLEVIGGGDAEFAPPTEPRSVLLRDPVSGQRLELNFYPPGDPHAVDYEPGEELDHVGIRVDDLDALLRRLAELGIRPEPMKHFEGPVLETESLRIAYVLDPDGIQLELFEELRKDGRGFDPDRY